MTLYLNTADLHKVIFKLLDGKKVIAEYGANIPPHTNDSIVKHLQEFLDKHKLTSRPSHFTSISVYSGVGSQTGLRIGTSIGQALSLAWNIPLKIVKK